MSTTPSIKVTLQHTTGALSTYKPGDASIADKGGIKEAIITCVAYEGHGRRVELLRSDLPGADWSAMERAGAFPELQQRLVQAAADLDDGHDPHVIITLNPDKTLGDAYLETNSKVVAEQLQDSSKRSLQVPRILPYQLGGTASGATAVIYSPVSGGGMRLHSLHPTDDEALMAQAQLQQQGETKSGLLKVHTIVTSLLAAVAKGEFRPQAPATETTAARAPSARPHPGLIQSPLAPPTPFATN